MHLRDQSKRSNGQRSHDNDPSSLPLQMAAVCGSIASLGQLLAVALPGWVQNYNNGTMYNTRGLWNECKDFSECRNTVQYNKDDPDRAMWLALWFTQLLGLFLCIMATTFAVMSIRSQKDRKLLRNLFVCLSLTTGFVIFNGLTVLLVTMVALGKSNSDLSYCFILAVFAVISSWLSGIAGCFHSDKKLARRREKRLHRREMRNQLYNDMYHPSPKHTLQSRPNRLSTWRSPFKSVYRTQHNAYHNHPHIY